MINNNYEDLDEIDINSLCEEDINLLDEIETNYRNS